MGQNSSKPMGLMNSYRKRLVEVIVAHEVTPGTDSKGSHTFSDKAFNVVGMFCSINEL